MKERCKIIVTDSLKNFVVYKSSAGSGKTFTLVKEYLKLSLCDNKKLHSNYKNILAITFTNKAAAEMKSRVVEALNQISKNEFLPFIGSILCNELQISELELKKRAKIVLSQLLHHYSDFSIGTIDSFTHKIVKTFAFDLKLPVNFNIELDTKSFYERVVALLFNKIGEDDYVSKLLKEFALSKAEANASWDPEKQLREFSSLLLKENAGEYIDKLKQFNAQELEEFRKQFIDYLKHYEATLKHDAERALFLIKQNNLCDDDFSYKKSGPINFFYKCIDNSVKLEDTEGSRLAEAIGKNKWARKESPNNFIVEKISAELTVIATELIQFIKQNHQYYSLCELLSKQMYPLMLLKKIEEISAEQKEEESLVFISEFNQKIFEIIQNEPTPFIYERLGERYHHYLLDEFQDTSNLQWQNILPLIDNSLSNGWFNLLVGDGKQSIYRWRSASVKQFAILPKIENTLHSLVIEEREDSLTRNFEEKILNTNYRSEKTIIEFNNRLFEHLSTAKLTEETQNIYANHSQLSKINVVNDNGYVTIHATALDRDELDIETCTAIKDKIQTALEDGYSYSDICILPRKNSDGNTIAQFLTQQKIPIISSDSLLLKNNLEVNTLVCYLSYLLNNRDLVSAASVINYLRATHKINASQFHIYLNQLSNLTSLFDILKSCSIHLNPNELLLNNLLDNCVELINALDMNKKAYHYIRFFLDEVNEFLVQKNSNLSLFFEWWEKRREKASVIIPDGTNAIKIMTIHASKGLEFPVVIVPYCNWAIYRPSESWVEVNNNNIKLPVSVVSLTKKAATAGFERELETEQQEQLLDNVNLLYVAFTRAVERLHVIANYSSGSTGESVAKWLENYIQLNNNNNTEGFYELGQRHKKVNASKNNNRINFELKALHFNANKDTVKIKASYLNNSEELRAAKKQGILVHWLLSKIKSVNDVDFAFKQALIEGRINRNEESVLRSQLSKLLNHSELSFYFNPTIVCKNEAELITQNGEILRPDKIVFDGETSIIIDYKTGKPDNNKYFKQLAHYENALLGMGYKKIKKLLVYVDEVSVVEVK